MRVSAVSDGGFGTRARFGLIVLQTDETLEVELSRLLAVDGTATYVTRIAMEDNVTGDTLAAMGSRLYQAAVLLPATQFSVIGYACTSGAAVIGASAVGKAISKGRQQPELKTTDPLSAVLAACRILSVRRLAVLTPYIGEVSDRIRTVLEKNGMSVVSFASFEQPVDSLVARISPSAVVDAALQVGRAAAADALFISCTNLRTLSVIAEIEAELGIPVLASNQALAWHMLRLAGIGDVHQDAGALFDVSAIAVE